MRSTSFQLFILAVGFGLPGCSGVSSGAGPGDGGILGVGGAGVGGSSGGAQASSGGATSAAPTGGAVSSGGQAPATGGRPATGGANPTGGTIASMGGNATGGAPTGGTPPTGGAPSTGGKTGAATGGAGVGGAATGGKSATGGAGLGGAATGGTPGTGGARTGGAPGTGGARTGGAPGTGGATGVAGGTSTVDCSATMPTGGTQHSGNSQGGANNLAWQIWSNQGTGTLTTFSTPAFHSGWNNSGNYLGRLGFEWGSAGKTFDQYGTIMAQFTETKSGSSGGAWSYIGIYGWSNNPCIEWYIIDDSFSTMPINPGNCANMSNSPLSIDGGQYTMCVRNTTGTGGDRCGGAGSWNQYYSIRRNNRTCGTISVTEHFKAWAAAGNKLGNLLEVKVLLEVGGGTGTVDFPIANVTKTQ